MAKDRVDDEMIQMGDIGSADNRIVGNRTKNGIGAEDEESSMPPYVLFFFSLIIVHYLF